MAGRLEQKVAVITGAGQGIGRASAIAFSNEGAIVWAADRNAAALTALEQLHPEIKTVVVDVTDRTIVESLADTVGTTDILFNCAGWVPAGTISDCTVEDWDSAMEINVRSMFLMTRAFLPHLSQGASIINMASVASSISGVPNRLAYGASKAAVIGLTKATAADLVGNRIRCNAIAPGTVDSPSLAERLAVYEDPEAARASFVARQPLGRLGTAEEVAALAVYLGSDESAYTTGSVYVIDGGMSL